MTPKEKAAQDVADLKKELAQFTGSSVMYKHRLVPNVGYTAGVHFLAENRQAYWLLDKVASHQLEAPFNKERMQTWSLTVTEGKGLWKISDGAGKVLLEDVVSNVDLPDTFDLDLYVIEDEGSGLKVIMFPSEY